MPSPLRALLYLIAITFLLIALHLCIQGAILLYDAYQLVTWLEGIGDA